MFVCKYDIYIYIYTSAYIIHVYNLQLHPLAPRLKDSTLPEHAPALSKKLWGVLGIVMLSQNASKTKDFDFWQCHWAIRPLDSQYNESESESLTVWRKQRFSAQHLTNELRKCPATQFPGISNQSLLLPSPTPSKKLNYIFVSWLVYQEHASGLSGTISRRTHLILKNTSTFVKTFLFWGHSR